MGKPKRDPRSRAVPRGEVVPHQELDLPLVYVELELEVLRAADEFERAKSEADKFHYKISNHVRFMAENFGVEINELVKLHQKRQPSVKMSPVEMTPVLAHERECREKEMKVILRRIRQKCHPDKTDDPLLHETYQLAMDAYELDDVEELRALGREVGPLARRSKPTATKAIKLRARLKMTKEKTEHYKQQLMMFMKSPVTKEMDDVQALIKQEGLETALKIIRRNIKEEIQKLKNQTATFYFRTTSTS